MKQHAKPIKNHHQCMLIFFSLWISNFTVHGQFVRVSLFNEVPVKSIVVSTLKGAYKVTGDSSFTMNLSDKEVMYISLFGQQIMLRNSQNAIGSFSMLKFEALDADGAIRLNLVSPAGDTRQYPNNLIVSVAYGRISLINEVLPENYIAGVVESEAGPNAFPEFYKAQAILARTYLYGHINRHQSEGFQLCDGVHCQAYKGRSSRNPEIVEATKATRGLVMVAEDSTYITAVFHANCGGETESAANAWLNGKSYLVSVKDPFCQNSPSARWTKTITLDQWKNYLKSHGFAFSKNVSPGNFDFSQINRKLYYIMGHDSIPTKQIRTDFQLHSTFFSIIATTKDVTIKGRGFGHGVGMCQDGAMQMAKIGYQYTDILGYYYKGARIVGGLTPGPSPKGEGVGLTP
jgi:stage II sporulation protein D